MQYVVVELLRILQGGKVADFGHQHQARGSDLRRHELGILALDCLVVVTIDDPGRRCDNTQLCLGEVWLGRRHLGDLIEEAFVFGRSREST